MFQYREAINSDFRLKCLLDRYMVSTDRLIELYEDKDGQRKAEVAALTGPNEFQEFYNRLKQIKDFYRKHPNEVGTLKETVGKILEVMFFATDQCAYVCGI